MRVAECMNRNTGRRFPADAPRAPAQVNNPPVASSSVELDQKRPEMGGGRSPQSCDHGMVVCVLGCGCVLELGWSTTRKPSLWSETKP